MTLGSARIVTITTMIVKSILLLLSLLFIIIVVMDLQYAPSKCQLKSHQLLPPRNLHNNTHRAVVHLFCLLSAVVMKTNSDANVCKQHGTPQAWCLLPAGLAYWWVPRCLSAGCPLAG